MLRVDEIDAHLASLDIPEAGRRYIHAVRTSPPSRLVGEYALRNVISQFCSWKMRLTIQTESRTAELPVARALEFSEHVLAFWDQPEPIQIKVLTRKGNWTTLSYTPDFLAICKGVVLVIEAKTQPEVDKLLKARPDQWRLEEGAPIFIPAREVFRPWGLRHVVWTNERFSQVFSSNTQTLLQVRHSGIAATSTQEALIFEHLTTHACQTLSNLAAVLGTVDTTPILSLVEQGRLHARLDQDLLNLPGTAWISTSPVHLAQLPNLLVPGRNIPSEGLTVPSEKELKQALDRLDALKAGRAPRRTALRHRKRISEGAEKGISDLAALVWRNAQKGNRTPRRTSMQEDTLLRSTEIHYAAATRSSITYAYNKYVLTALETHPDYPPVSRRTFRRAVARMDPAVVADARKGRRAGNSAARPSEVESRAIPALRPFEQACIDHHQVAVFVSFGPDSRCKPLKPWLTLLRDVATGAILAIWISFRAPSRAHIFAVLRRCARAFGRLPELIHSDRGSNLRSTDYLHLTAQLTVDISHSPAGYSRFNGPVESIFGIAQLEFFQGLPGNAVHAVGNRQASRSHNSKALAEIGPEDMWRLLLAYAEHFNNAPTDIVSGSPLRRLKAGLEQYPFSGKMVPSTPEFLVNTSAEYGRYRVTERSGIKVGPQYYHCPQLALRTDPLRKVPVRLDSDNPHVIYAQISGRWHACEASRNSIFARMTDAEQCIEYMRVVDAQHLNLQIRTLRQQDAISLQKDVLATKPEPSLKPAAEHTAPPPTSVFELARRVDVPGSLSHHKEVSRHVLDIISQTEPRQASDAHSQEL